MAYHRTDQQVENCYDDEQLEGENVERRQSTDAFGNLTARLKRALNSRLFKEALIFENLRLGIGVAVCPYCGETLLGASCLRPARALGCERGRAVDPIAGQES